MSIGKVGRGDLGVCHHPMIVLFLEKEKLNKMLWTVSRSGKFLLASPAQPWFSTPSGLMAIFLFIPRLLTYLIQHKPHRKRRIQQLS